MEITINIAEREVTIIQKSNNEEVGNITFENDTWWVGDYLCFTSNQQFYITSANENKMHFGELETPALINGKVKWAKNFQRKF